MITLLEGYIQHSLDDFDSFHTHSNLTEKVGENGQILPYHGNTTVFLLNSQVRSQLAVLQDRLYQAAPDMLAERLETQTLHMTLHSLVDGPPDTPALYKNMKIAHWLAQERLDRWTQDAPLRMRGTWMFNMVNTSVVLGLAPADEDSWRRLSNMYDDLEQVRFLGYAMTPHITLAYYRPGQYDQAQVARLRAALAPVPLEFELKMEDLVIQNFQSMNCYETQVSIPDSKND